ncbi:DUF3021 domain-containing protein [Lactobacillus xylocopicola]|uniref:DUF3021 domain-containing protein n=1 Tax=Lactobacillus xylocopicola TaxID=2976676 RepID=A0ABN6SN31_9LACO|nr:DUF3021 domain-containing protein [Lactobacillus xylocopicola]BDR60954.1 hypothetical protein KIM322_12150 [Lactobacillus xylocopicola]
MKLFNRCLDYFLIGVAFGAIAYLLILTFAYGGIAPTPKGVLSVLTLSGLMGLVSMIFISDITFTLALLIHLLGIFLLFAVMMMINSWPINLWSLGIFLVTYLVIWLICILDQRRSVKQINARIKKRNK